MEGVQHTNPRAPGPQRSMGVMYTLYEGRLSFRTSMAASPRPVGTSR
jgi:hypothetical protein